MLEAGAILGGKYRLLQPTGAGGTGAVWQAVRIDLDAPVAVKVMHSRVADKEGSVERFRVEARAVANLRSPHLVQLLDYGVDDETELAFVVTELLEGESLRDRLKCEVRLTPTETSRWVTDLAKALSVAHEVGIVHRYLKPENLFIAQQPDGSVLKVLDFGIARSASTGLRELTATGAPVASLHYMAPERIEGGERQDLRADLWSVAVIAYECLTGRRPFDSDTLSGLAMQITRGRFAPASSVAEVPAGFDAWFEQGTRLDPEERFQSVAALSAALRSVCAGELALESAAAAPASVSATEVLQATEESEPSSVPMGSAPVESAEELTAVGPDPEGVESAEELPPTSPDSEGVERDTDALAIPVYAEEAVDEPAQEEPKAEGAVDTAPPLAQAQVVPIASLPTEPAPRSGKRRPLALIALAACVTAAAGALAWVEALNHQRSAVPLQETTKALSPETVAPATAQPAAAQPSPAAVAPPQKPSGALQPVVEPPRPAPEPSGALQPAVEPLRPATTATTASRAVMKAPVRARPTQAKKSGAGGNQALRRAVARPASAGVRGGTSPSTRRAAPRPRRKVLRRKKSRGFKAAAKPVTPVASPEADHIR